MIKTFELVQLLLKGTQEQKLSATQFERKKLLPSPDIRKCRASKILNGRGQNTCHRVERTKRGNVNDAYTTCERQGGRT